MITGAFVSESLHICCTGEKRIGVGCGRKERKIERAAVQVSALVCDTGRPDCAERVPSGVKISRQRSTEPVGAPICAVHRNVGIYDEVSSSSNHRLLRGVRLV